jgi:hypothetical protein
MTSKEDAMVFIMRMNKEIKRIYPETEIRKKWTFFGFDIRYSRRSKNCLWGRFGGGWNWEFGIQIGGETICFNLLIAQLQITWRKT